MHIFCIWCWFIFYLKQPHENIKNDGIVEFLKVVKDNEPVKAVVCDWDFNLSLVKLIRAQLYLSKPDCLFIVGATDAVLKIKEDSLMGE